MEINGYVPSAVLIRLFYLLIRFVPIVSNWFRKQQRHAGVFKARATLTAAYNPLLTLHHLHARESN
jgi:hypothetical protein